MRIYACARTLALVTITKYVTSISAHSLLSAYFLTTYTYKRMRLITRVYGIINCFRKTSALPHNGGTESDEDSLADIEEEDISSLDELVQQINLDTSPKCK